jgi:DNA replication protein DnaC
MITTEKISENDLIEINIKGKLANLYTTSGFPKKYHFANLETDWSKTFSPSGTLTGMAKKRSEAIYNFTQSYIQAIDNIVAGSGLKVKFKDSIQFVTDMLLDGTKSSGKTILLSIIGQAAINKGYSVKFVEWAEYLDRFMTFELRDANEPFFQDCLDVDFLIFDSICDYGINNNKFFTVQLDRLISSRLNNGKVTIASIDTADNLNPVFGMIWNKFTRETFTFKLPEATILNENKSKRT